MPQEQTPYKLYKTSISGLPSVALLPGTNTPHGYSEIDYAGLGAAAKEYGDYYKSELDKFTQRGSTSDYNRTLNEYNTKYGGDEFYNSLASGNFDINKVAGLFGLNDKLDVLKQMGTGATVGSGNVAEYKHPLTGEVLRNVSVATIKNIEDQVKGIQDGTLRDIGNGMTVPTGSAADLQLKGKSYEEQLNTPSVQKQITDQNLTPVAPGTPGQPGQVPGAIATPQTPQTPTGPGFSELLIQTWLSRPDLQALYNPDGSAKDKNNPKIAGIPTLMDWAKTFGINESPQLKEAYSTYQRQAAAENGMPATPSDAGSIAGASTGSGGSGVGEAGGPFQDPLLSFKNFYQQLYKEIGLDSIKDRISTQNKEIEKLNNELTDEIAEINDNPWLSEADRSRQVNKLKEKYSSKQEALVNRLKLDQDLYDDARDEIKFIAEKQFNLEKDVMLKQMDIAERRAEAIAKLGDNDLEYLSPSEAASLGVPYGTTRGEAAGMGITPKKDIAGLAPEVATKVTQIAGQFDDNPIVKKYNVIAEGYNFAKSINTNTKNPADDQALIYAFAKAMDPDSVVREGEYNTVQKYSQSWLQSFGFNAQRVIENKEFLTPEARANLKSTIEGKFKASEANYKNVYDEFGRRINKLTGNTDGVDYLTNYGQAFNGNTGGERKTINGVEYEKVDGGWKKVTFNSAGNASASTGNTPYLKTLGAITGLDGSPYWKYGLDVDLKKGDPVKSPVSGKVIAVGNNGGFGKQVKIQDPQGRIWALSHLDSFSVKQGQTITAGSLVGKGGNTGKVIPVGGGDGSHLDITVYKDGKPIAARQVKSLLDNIRV